MAGHSSTADASWSPASQARRTLEALIRLFRLSEADLGQLLDQALAETLAITKSAVGYIYFYDEGTRLFTLHAWSDSVMAACSITEKQTTYELDKTGLWGEAVRRRAPVLVNDFQAPDPCKKGYPEGHVPLRNFLTIPVFHADAVTAVIGVGNKHGDYVPDDVTNLELIARGVWSMVLRRQAEEEARAGRELRRLQRILDATPAPLYHSDPQGLVSGCNNAFAAFFGLAKPDAAGKTLPDLLGIDPALLPEEDADPAEFPVQAQGKTRHVLFRRSSYKNRRGQRLGSIGVLTDITLRKRMESELAERENTFREILRGIRAGILVVDPRERTVLDANDIALGIVGLPRDLLLGSPCTALRWIRQSDNAPADCCPMDGPEIINEEYRIERPDGTTLPVSRTVVPAVRSGQTLHYEILFDVGERKALERQLALAQRLESLGGLASGIAHEINTPIQYIGDNLTFLEGAFTDLGDRLAGQERDEDLDFLLEEIPNALSQSREGVARVAGIVGAMKRFSHAGGEEMGLLDLPKAIENATVISRNEWKYHAEITLDLDPELRYIPCRPGDFNQVLLNLLVNASHAITDKYRDTGEKGRITVTTRNEDGWMTLSVLDTGCGIPAANIHRVYDPFFTTKEVGKGTGQGLALCHDIVVKKHGGSITVDSQPGQWTRFTVRLPLDKTPENDP
ncbi:Sporulation kinase E [Fundidesulfovibrio magnetotacticus]|uniref:histidine kinase n=1 Tax=Fundidesulfovibrio magnetotacticus TaxID=2730080 RepID=A0A6V8M183_9BACT|nr:GAF domain-containing protein [Fundidesulfovibrio magnetotacticus]GFK95989.1 Sporulation kinase E [Fundidesulfovibrio magnetotacticus]